MNLKCPECGGTQAILDGETAKCLYCGRRYAIKTTSHNEGTFNAPQSPQQPQVIYIQQPAQSYEPARPQYRNSKSKGVALILLFFFPGLGIGNMYLGNVGLGVLGLIFGSICYFSIFLFWIPLIVGIIHFLSVLFMSEDTFNEKYNR